MPSLFQTTSSRQVAGMHKIFPPQSRAMQVFTQVALRFEAIKKGFGDLFFNEGFGDLFFNEGFGDLFFFTNGTKKILPWQGFSSCC